MSRRNTTGFSPTARMLNKSAGSSTASSKPKLKLAPMVTKNSTRKKSRSGFKDTVMY